jgi:lysozyme family protein
MASVMKALAFVFPNEGGYVNDPRDNGGPTKYGITHKTLAAARKKRPKAGYPVDVRDLTMDQAAHIYENDFVPDGFDKIESQQVGTVLFDMGVNAGPDTAEVLMQRALCAAGSPVVVDGKIGPRTLAAINGTDTGKLLAAFVNQRRAYYQHCIEKDPENECFRKNWMHRAGLIPPAGA